MKQLLKVSIPLILVVLVSVSAQIREQPTKGVPKAIVSAEGISVEVYDFDNFVPFTKQLDGKIHVINFWATWCVPCVKELPYFNQLKDKNPELEITFVSLDFPASIKKQLIPFLIENKLRGEVIVLDEPDGNKWIPQMDENWSGAIPATIVYKDEKSYFYEKSFTLSELEEAISRLN